MTEEEAKSAIEHNLVEFAERGIPRRPGDMEALLCYRRSLSTEDQVLYDMFVQEGNHAGVAAQQVEIITARALPHSADERRLNSVKK